MRVEKVLSGGNGACRGDRRRRIVAHGEIRILLACRSMDG